MVQLNPNPLAMNPAMTQETPAGPGGLSFTGASNALIARIRGGYDQAKSQHSKLLESAKRLDVVRSELDELAKLGDTVTPEDVIKGAGALVGAGFDPTQMATMLAQMPTAGGQALAAWVQQADAGAQQHEASMAQAMQQSKIHMGATALASLRLDHRMDKLRGGLPQPQASQQVEGGEGGPTG